MATRCCNGQPLLLQQGPSFSSVTSSHCCIDNHGHGTRGLNYHVLEPVAIDVALSPKVVGLPEASPGQEWNARKQRKQRWLRRICPFVCLFVFSVVVSVGVCVALMFFGSLQRTICIPCSPEDSKANDARRPVGTSKDASKGYLCCASGDDEDQMKEIIIEVSQILRQI